MPRVYVVGALIPRGGAFMAYHIGLILHRDFGYDLVNVQVQPTRASRQFEYEVTPKTVRVAEMEKAATADDILIVNPSFSRALFGLRLPCKTISYVQDFRTFQVLDPYCDLYVSVSPTVQAFLHAVYGFETSLIPPFIQLGRMPAPVPWRKRPVKSILMYVKPEEENQRVGEYLKREIHKLLPDLKLSILADNNLPHAEFMQRLANVRYFINASLAEGFGLVPLEAMALGCCVTGLNGLAGKDFMSFGRNSLAHSFQDIDHIPTTLKTMLQDEDNMEAMSKQAIADAQKFNRSVFRDAWRHVLALFLEGRMRA